jgi:hypothetical protein
LSGATAAARSKRGQGLVDLAESHQHLSQLVQRLGVIGTLDKRFLVRGLRCRRIGR